MYNMCKAYLNLLKHHSKSQRHNYRLRFASDIVPLNSPFPLLFFLCQSNENKILLYQLETHVYY